MAACLLAMAVADDKAPAPGMRPRPQLSDYAAHESVPALTLAAEILSKDQVENAFATDLNKGWMVIEAALYPQHGIIAVDPSAFMLRVAKGDSRKILRPVSPAAIAAALQRKEAPPEPSDITLYPTVGVGYEAGPGYYDPVYGARRGGGLRTTVGLGVGIGGQAGPPPPASNPADRKTMEVELTDQALPQGSTAKPIAGYLYFPRPNGNLKDAALQLVYESGERPVSLPLTLWR
jgi:hypothetical protein